MTDVLLGDDSLPGWDPRRRAVLEELWAAFEAAGGSRVDLGAELMAERRGEAEAEDQQARLR